MWSSRRRNGPRRILQLARWCRENTGTLPKMAQQQPAHNHNVQPSQQATVILVEKYSNGCIRAQDFEGLQGQSGIKDGDTGGKRTTECLERRGLSWTNGQQHTPKYKRRRFKASVYSLRMFQCINHTLDIHTGLCTPEWQCVPQIQACFLRPCS